MKETHLLRTIAHLLLCCVVGVVVVGASATNLTTTNNLTASLSRDPGFECTPLKVFDLKLGYVQDCAAAIITLPQPVEPTFFHRGGRADIGQLPVVTTFGDCEVEINIVGTRDFSSWPAIGLAASLLVTACTDISLNRPYTGGWVSTGNEAKIQIAVRRAEQGGAARAVG